MKSHKRSRENALDEDNDNIDDTNEQFQSELKSESKIGSRQSSTTPEHQLPPKKRMIMESLSSTTSVADNRPSNETDYTQNIVSTDSPDEDNSFIEPEPLPTNHNQSVSDYSEFTLGNIYYHFLFGLHPHMSKLGSIQNRKVRMKIHRLLFKELKIGRKN